MDMLVIKSTLKVQEARSLRRLLLTVARTGIIAMLRAGLHLPLYTPPLFSTLTTIRGEGDHGELVSALGIWKAISATRRGRPYALLKTISMCRALRLV